MVHKVHNSNVPTFLGTFSQSNIGEHKSFMKTSSTNTFMQDNLTIFGLCNFVKL